MLARVSEFVGRVSDKRSTSLLFSLGTMALFGLFDFVVDLALTMKGLSWLAEAEIQAAIVGIGTGVVSYLLLAARRERRQIVREELCRVAELNHHLRNSLQIIAGAHYMTDDQAHARMILDTVHAMDAVLKRLFPATGTERRATTRKAQEILNSLKKTEPPISA